MVLWLSTARKPLAVISPAVCRAQASTIEPGCAAAVLNSTSSQPSGVLPNDMRWRSITTSKSPMLSRVQSPTTLVSSQPMLNTSSGNRPAISVSSSFNTPTVLFFGSLYSWICGVPAPVQNSRPDAIRGSMPCACPGMSNSGTTRMPRSAAYLISHAMSS